MRFHHSTRRGRNRLGQYGQHQTSSRSARHPTSTSRWLQLGYCRETNIHFNRRLPIEPPPSTSSQSNEFIDTPATRPQKSHLIGPKTKQTQETNNNHKLPLDQKHSLELGRMTVEEAANAYRLSASSPDSGASGLSQPEQQQLDAGLGRLALGGGDQQPARLRRGQSADCRGKASHNNKRAQAGCEQQRQLARQEDSIDMESAREKLVAQVEKHPFWSKKAARRMQLTGLRERHIFIYELVSFCERRDLEWRFEPYRGGLVPSIPFRRLEAAASQPATPTGQDPSARRFIRVPRPQLSLRSSLDTDHQVEAASPPNSGDSLLWSSGCLNASGGSDWGPQSTGDHHQPRGSTSRNSSAVRRSRSAANSPVLLSPQPAGAASFEPAGSMECKLPSAEFVWSIEAPAYLRPEPFVGQMHSCELPGSSFVKRCHGCQGRGRLKCASCYGVGYEVCISCSGKGTTRSQAALGGGSRANDRCDSYSARNSTSANGYDDPDHLNYRASSGGESRNRGNEPGGISGSGGGSNSGAWFTESCHFCHGAGQKRCWVCAGKSYNHCQGCLGLGQLRCYLNLNITWTNHRDESILNNSDQIIPKERLRLSSGTLLLAEESPASTKLRALERTRTDGATGSADDSNQLHLASKRLLDKHSQGYRNERLIKQRHKVTQIQCHVVDYEWKHRRGHFVIYGDERKVYIAKYPFKSICNIT